MKPAKAERVSNVEKADFTDRQGSTYDERNRANRAEITEVESDNTFMQQGK